MAIPAPAAGDPGAPGWAAVRAEMITAARECAAAAGLLGLRGQGGGPAARMAWEAAETLRWFAALVRPLAFGETLIEAEAERRAAEVLAAAGLSPAGLPLRRPGRHLRAVP